MKGGESVLEKFELYKPPVHEPRKWVRFGFVSKKFSALSDSSNFFSEDIKHGHYGRKIFNLQLH